MDLLWNCQYLRLQFVWSVSCFTYQEARQASEKAHELPKVDERVNRAVASANKAANAARVASVKAVSKRMHHHHRHNSDEIPIPVSRAFAIDDPHFSISNKLLPWRISFTKHLSRVKVQFLLRFDTIKLTRFLCLRAHFFKQAYLQALVFFACKV